MGGGGEVMLMLASFPSFSRFFSTPQMKELEATDRPNIQKNKVKCFQNAARFSTFMSLCLFSF